MTKAEVEARRAAKLKRLLEGPPRVAAVATWPESVEHWRQKVAATGLDVAVIGDKDSIFPEGDIKARFVFADPPKRTSRKPSSRPPKRPSHRALRSA